MEPPPPEKKRGLRAKVIEIPARQIEVPITNSNYQKLPSKADQAQEDGRPCRDAVRGET